MLIVHNKNIDQNNDINRNVWTEEYLLNAQQNKYLENWSSVNELTKLKIRRIIQSDDFIITFEHFNNLKNVQEIKVSGFINNKNVEFKPVYDLNVGRFIFTYNSNLDSKNKLEFKDINNLNFEIQYKVNNYWYQTKSFSYWIKPNSRSKNISINNETNIEILSEIIITSLPDRIDKNLINHSFETKYLNLSFKPSILKQAFYNTKILDLRITKFNKQNNEFFILDNSDIYDLKFSDLSILNNLKNKYEIKLNYQSFNSMQVNVDSYSYFDKYSNDVIINNQNPKSKPGLLIPLNYSGVFGYELNFNIGKNLKNFKLSYSQEINKPFFGLNNGLIRLKTKNIKGWLTDEKWIKIKYENFNEIINSANSLNNIEEIGDK
ncbi:MHO_1580 family protein [Metamycoplasma gateae]|uniref:DUF31 domain-containing protein n=1 Tax=Metamycoplasma gateae TaxID=35769 RepID=A0ABZ2AIH5_9BACT|nr:hypothetical protein V2E26_01130 [Metamycoplasma gateae]